MRKRTGILLTTILAWGTIACAPGKTSTLAIPSVSSSTGNAVTSSNETCRVPSDAVPALTGHYTATVQTSIYGALQLDWFLSAETVSGYSGQFLKSTMTVNGSRGSSTQVSIVCTETYRSGNVLQGVMLYSEPTSFTPFDYVYAGGQLRTQSQMAVSAQGGGTYLFDSSHSWSIFKTTDNLQTLSATISGLQKM